MSEAQNILDAIESQFTSYSGLSYVNRFAMNEDEADLVKDSKFPFINLQFTKLNILPADNQNPRDFERHSYTLQITFGVRNKKKSTALQGTASIKGLWDLHDDIRGAVRSDMTFNGNVNSTIMISEVETGVVKDIGGNFWIAGGTMSIVVYKDVYVKRLNKY